MYDVIKARIAQKELCEEKEYPHFTPTSGKCWRYGKNIYEEVKHPRTDPITGEKREYSTGITVEKAATELVTGCPHCNRSYCD